MIRVRTASRLHFGLLSLPATEGECWPGSSGDGMLPVRLFGGVGLMVEDPATQVTVAPASVWSASGALAERALTFAQRFAQSLSPDILPPQRLSIEQGVPEHCGLGAGTQLGLAVARALALVAGHGNLSAIELARRVGRGQRSALGVHGFAQGGFLVDGGKRSSSEIATLAARADFPKEWRVVLVLPTGGPARHGIEEQQAFQKLAECGGSPTRADALCRLVLLGMLPALAERDLEAFGETLYDFNVQVGQLFAPVQGGTYASPAIAEMVTFVRQQGVHGVGQSSWGHTVFAIVADADRAQNLAERIRERFALDETQVRITRAANKEATVESEAGACPA